MLQVGLKLEKFPERRDVTPPEISTRILDAESDSISVMPRQREQLNAKRILPE
jgi:hypothetical protein